MTMTLTMTVKARGHLVLDFAYLAAHVARDSAPIRLATIDGVAVSDLSTDTTPELQQSPNHAT